VAPALDKGIEAAERRGVEDRSEGLVVEVHGMLVTVLSAGQRVRARPPRSRETPVIGDRVVVEKLGSEFRVAEIAPRARVFSRLGVPAQVIAAHVDRLVIVTAVDPGPRPGLIDRMWIAMGDAAIAAREVEVLLVLNKHDLPGFDSARALLDDHVSLGAEVVMTSTRTGEGIEGLRARLASGGLSLVVGHSGVGKSSLVNALVPGAALMTGDVNTTTAKGRHTTTVATCHLLGADAVLVDTPGVRAFSLDALPFEAVAARFPGFAGPSQRCHFAHCLHEGEPACEVADLALRGALPSARHDRYLALLSALREERAEAGRPKPGSPRAERVERGKGLKPEAGRKTQLTRAERERYQDESE